MANIRKYYSSKAFTLIELIVVISIITIITGLFLANYSAGGRQSEVIAAANILAKDFRRAQSNTLNLLSYGSSTPLGGWGIHAEKKDNFYYIFADQNNNQIYDQGEAEEALGGGKIDLPENVVFGAIYPDGIVDAVFRPASSTVNILGLESTSTSVVLVLDDKNSNAANLVRFNFLGLAETYDFLCGYSTVKYNGGPYDQTGASRNQGGYYRTVQVGGQCWLRDNLNTTAASPLSPNNQLANLVTHGGLYTLSGALENSKAPGVNGICPTGWRIPTDTDWHKLELYLADPGNESNCSGSRSGAACTPAATSLIDGGGSGFDALFAGYYNGAAYSGFSTGAYFWTSTYSGNSAYVRNFTSATTVNRSLEALPSSAAYSVRCLKD